MIQLRRGQKIIVLVGMILIQASFLFPCWECWEEISNLKMKRDYEYGFLLMPPKSGTFVFCQIDGMRLLFQIGVVVLLTIGGLVITNSPRKSN